MRSISSAALFAWLAVLAVGCTRNIPNTTVPDSPENREVLEFMENYRHAVEDRDVGALLRMVSPLYLDDVGTPTGDDDLDSRTLPERLAAWHDRVQDVRFEIRYRHVRFENERVFVEYRYTASFRMAGADGHERWARRIGDHRAVLQRDEASGELRFLSGL